MSQMYVRHEEELVVTSVLPSEHEFEIDLGDQNSEPDPLLRFHFLSANFSWNPTSVFKKIDLYELTTIGPDAYKIRARFRVYGPGTFKLTGAAVNDLEQLA